MTARSPHDITPALAPYHRVSIDMARDLALVVMLVGGIAVIWRMLWPLVTS